ncbi:MAG: elongation factor P [Pseudomonadota bacterium]
MGHMMRVTALRTGNLVIVDGDIYRVHAVEHRTPGKGNACMQTKLRSIKTGNLIDKRFLSNEKVERAELDNIKMEFLYKDDTGYIFMNTENYEQLHLSEDVIGEGVGFLLPNTQVQVEFYDNKPVGIEFKLNVVLKVVDTEPFMKRATASAQTKPATLETGLKIIVPGFVAVGELVKVNTETTEYVSRADSYDE